MQLDDCSAHTPEAAGSEDEGWRNNVPPIVSENQIRDHLRSLNFHESMGPNSSQSPEGTG